MNPPLRLGTRRSALAWAQASGIAAALQAAGLQIEMVPVVTTGDSTPGPLTTLGGTGVFATTLRNQLRDGEIDLAVHSYKDLPTVGGDEELVIAAVPLRADPRDVLCSRGGTALTALPDGARIGTGAPRRAAQLAALGRGLVAVPIRGNVDTRLGKIATGELDAVVLAAAGLERLGRSDAVTETLAPRTMMPAPAQGALAIECRADAALAEELHRILEHSPSRAAVTAERALLTRMEAGCLAPIGALATVADQTLTLDMVVAAPDGSRALRGSVTGQASGARELGVRLADELLAAGAGALLPG